MWRAENGFRNGYLGQLERIIKVKIPTSTLKVAPNIESQVKLFRSKTTAIADILQISGFVWNYERCTIECEKSAYDEYIKNHKEAAGLYGKAFPFFNDLVAIFARDRAHGSARGDVGDDAEQYLQENVPLDDDTNFFQMASDDVCMPTQEPVHTPSPVGSETSTSRARRKRKTFMDPSMETISQNFHNFVEIIGPGLKTLAEATAREVALDEAREKAREDREKALEAREKAYEVAQAEIEEMKKLLSQVIFEIEGLSDDEAMFILPVFLLLTIHF
ncbi:Apolipoprotein [Dioscorea alata]|uniref:Apolipoprotein n=1 Tax=Dioscorea alata TaxID=55571 RepID=A0ACB7UL44_DIOAL|nr:Apolipoprotein [Dioscorea alata]